mgnify:CR=1 FL=1
MDDEVENSETNVHVYNGLFIENFIFNPVFLKVTVYVNF